jgi:hypothetical protein
MAVPEWSKMGKNGRHEKGRLFFFAKSNCCGCHIDAALRWGARGTLKR